MSQMNVLARRFVGPAAALALLATGCKSQSPCSPPACMAEAPACAPVVRRRRGRPTSRRRVPAARSWRRAPPVMATRVDPEMQAKIDVLRTSVEAQHRQNAEIEAQNAAAAKAAEDEVRRKAGAEQAAQSIADELQGVPGPRSSSRARARSS